ncbi:MAG: metal-dependent transcriptional regulator [Clostridiales bacterium]|nr:metal-dependent transcriptional regulator [Clostridiales bacterium]
MSVGIPAKEEKVKDHESEEMYLETILLLKSEKAAVRSIDVAERLGYAKSSVSRAVNLLQDRGYIVIDDDGFIGFTQSGESKAKNIYDRHRVLTKLFVSLGADIALAEENACRIEHVIDDKIFDLIKAKVGE